MKDVAYRVVNDRKAKRRRRRTEGTVMRRGESLN